MVLYYSIVFFGVVLYLVARLARVDDLANFLPLYLEGDALVSSVFGDE